MTMQKDEEDLLVHCTVFKPFLENGRLKTKQSGRSDYRQLHDKCLSPGDGHLHKFQQQQHHIHNCHGHRLAAEQYECVVGQFGPSPVQGGN
jgi:hypothetical protein